MQEQLPSDSVTQQLLFGCCRVTLPLPTAGALGDPTYLKNVHINNL